MSSNLPAASDTSQAGASKAPTTDITPSTPAAAPPSLLRAAGLIAMVTLFSKGLGMLRDWQIVHVYGANISSDAYFAAFQLPSFALVLLGGLGGPFHTATVAFFSRLIADGQKPSEAARQLASGFLTLTSLVFAVLAVLTGMFARPIMALILQHASSELIDNAAVQLQIMSPIVFLGGLIGIFYGLLNLYHRFFWPSLSPAMLNLVIIGALFVFPADPAGHLLAWATLGGTIVQLLSQLPSFFKLGFSAKPMFNWLNPNNTSPDNKNPFQELGELLFPAIVGTTIGQFNVYVDMFFTASLPPGGWTAIVLGNRLIQLPLGVLQTALLVPIFPRFARYVVEGDIERMLAEFKKAIIALWVISMPMLVIILLHGQTLIRLVFEHGQFDAQATAMVTQVLFCLGFMMLPYYARDTLTRMFYAFKDTKTPLLVGLIAIGTNFALDWLFLQWFGLGGIALSTSVVTFLNMLLLAVLLRQKHMRQFSFAQLFGYFTLPFVKIITCGLLMAWLCQLSQGALSAIPLFAGYPAIPATLVEILNLIISGGIGLFIYTVTVMALNIPEVDYLIERAKAKIQGHSTP